MSTRPRRPQPCHPWRLAQQWNDLLFAHWPIPARHLEAHLPAALAPDLHDGWAWIGVVPFWMSGVRTRLVGSLALAIPSIQTFPELNLRTYVRSRQTGQTGVFFFSLDTSSPLAVLGARTLFHLPYFLAAMSRQTSPNGEVSYSSRRRLSRHPVEFRAHYKPLEPLPASEPGTLQHFLTERYRLFTTTSAASRLLVGEIHHQPWPLYAAEAEIESNSLASAIGLQLPRRPAVLHFSRNLDVHLWPLAPERASTATALASSSPRAS